MSRQHSAPPKLSKAAIAAHRFQAEQSRAARTFDAQNNINATFKNKTYLFNSKVSAREDLCYDLLNVNCLQVTINAQLVTAVNSTLTGLTFDMARTLEYDPRATRDSKGKYSSSKEIALQSQIQLLKKYFNQDAMNEVAASLASLLLAKNPNVIKSGVTYISQYVHDLRFTIATDELPIEVQVALKAKLEAKFLSCVNQVNQDIAHSAANLIGLVSLVALLGVPVYFAYKKCRKNDVVIARHAGFGFSDQNNEPAVDMQTMHANTLPAPV
ncbi:MAG: hypothetical protein NTZ67_03185 [Gammaproteobacteria bacterium]|nr:hypothetical protein [Gammaproteobacteria bacterium]